MLRIYAVIFSLSGVSGLIYESVWSHYVKLILGHAAYAQTLVLAIFMGGMAVGAWLVARISARMRNLLLAYALVEAVIGVIALVFQPIFESSTRLLFDTLLPGLESGAAASATKLLVSVLLILPQSLLLGATFPLMSGGILRSERGADGATISLLYFANSIGAVVGVLWSGFWLISKVGLAGTLLTAGLINIALALVVYVLVKRTDQGGGAPARFDVLSATVPAPKNSGYRWVLWAASITGMASFCYEIAWIRMLSMVLGSSTQSFELMLAAFILGLALGGLWIRRRIDRIENPKLFLGIVQVGMGVLALATLPLYNSTFDLMAAAMQGLSRTDSGYVLFSLLGHVVAMIVMLPATFCAGMTLPLLTLILMKGGHGEKAIGQVYAANTLGAIVGVVIAVHIFMPMAGLKGLMLFGTLLDGLLGLFLIATATGHLTAFQRYGWQAAFAVVWMACLARVEFDPYRMVGGVFRYAKASADRSAEMLFWKDGKTASVGVIRDPAGYVSIATNGKSDAALKTGGHGTPTSDEITMALAGIVPFLYVPDLKTVANIGFGSGMTTHVLLASKTIEQVDTIEIEPAMFEGARVGFESRIPLAFSDPRSRIIIDDARSHFSSHGKSYDAIVSEPSNPWVSGVASLFSLEYYRHVSRYLAENGVFVQWLQLYETSPLIVASVFKALDQSFSDYAIYATDFSNMLIVAKKSGSLPPPDYSVLGNPMISSELRKIGLLGQEDISLRLVGNKRLWSPMLAAIAAPVNSDFFPYVDQNAARFRYVGGKEAGYLLRLGEPVVPVLEALKVRPAPTAQRMNGGATYFSDADKAVVAQAMRDGRTGLPEGIFVSQAILAATQSCEQLSTSKVQAAHELAKLTIPYLHPSELESLWKKYWQQHGCSGPGSRVSLWLEFFRELGARRWHEVDKHSAGLLAREGDKLAGDLLETLVLANLTSRLVVGDKEGFLETISNYLDKAIASRRLTGGSLPVDLVISQARNRGWLQRVEAH